MDNNVDDKEFDKKQKEQQAAQNTAHLAGKAFSTYAGGKLGKELYDMASNTEVGKRIEQAAGNALHHNRIANKASQVLNDSGALNAADKGLDVATGSGMGGLDNSNSSDNLNSSQENSSDSNKTDFLSNITGNGLISSNNNKKYIAMILGGAGFLVFGIIFMVLFSSVLAPLNNAVNFVKGIWNNITDWILPSQQELERQYYQELKDVQDEFNKKGICIDINLITATLTASKSFDDLINEGGQIDQSGESEIVLDSEGNPQEVPFKKMKKQIRLLANMQIMTKNYGLNSNLKQTTGSYCIDKTREEYNSYEMFQLVDGTTKDYFYDTDFFNKDNGVDSSSYELIAKHDISDFAKFFTKKSSEEKNYAYYLYHPSFDENGECGDAYAKDLLDKLPEDDLEVSIGDYSTRTESVYYWNLVNSFISDYYSDYLPSEEPAKTEKIQQIADEIYLLYETLGPSQTCTVAYSGPSNLCPNGITIENVGTLDFEEYIAGVVSREAYVSEGMEALKAQAVAARTYALNYTNYCNKQIPNSTNAQTFTRDINDRAREAVQATLGEILIYNGNIFSAQYDSFCYDDKDCPDARVNSDGTYSVTYTKVPGGEKHTITLSDSSQYKRITHGQGHAHGMSQLLSYQMAKEGKNYKEILSYFYSDGVEINVSLSPTLTEGAEIIQADVGTYLAANNSSVDAMNQYIFSQVRTAGVGTRQGVVAAAVSLVSGFYNQTGYKLPYELYHSGKYTGYGMDPNWGSKNNHATYKVNGLDCSGFISWAIHNGGYAYEGLSAKGWGNNNMSTKRSWSKGTTDSSAQPGDLIFNAPASNNGTTGHIRMIVDVTSDGYIVAEASSNTNGVRINSISFTSTGAYYLVDMSNYYATATKVTDYPS